MSFGAVQVVSINNNIWNVLWYDFEDAKKGFQNFKRYLVHDYMQTLFSGELCVAVIVPEIPEASNDCYQEILHQYFALGFVPLLNKDYDIQGFKHGDLFVERGEG